MTMLTFDQRTVDSAGAFMIGELERLDKTLNEPLYEVSYQRDIDFREDVVMSDESASFTTSTFSASGTAGKGISWIGAQSTAIGGVGIDIKKTPQPLKLWGLEVGWTIIELDAAAQLGRPIDDQQYMAMKTKHQLDTDQLVYVGDSSVGSTGLINNPNISVYGGLSSWIGATPEQILEDVNLMLTYAWKRSGYTVCPDQMRLPPLAFSALTKPVSAAGSISILKYVTENCLSAQKNGRPLIIHPLKWLEKAGVGGKDRVLMYTRDRKYVQFPQVPITNTPVQYWGLRQLTWYYCKFGELEVRYPETITYADLG